MKKLTKFAKTNQLRQFIDVLTRPDSNTCIDLILSNCDIVKESGTLDTNISDHLPIFFIRKKIKTVKTKTSFRGQSYKNIDQELFEKNFNNFTWENYANNDLDTFWDTLYNRIMLAADKFCPVQDFKFSSDKPIWLKNDVIAIMKAQDDCLKIYGKAKTEENKANMRRARNLTNVSVKLARADYIKEQLDIFNNDPKKNSGKRFRKLSKLKM